MREAVGTGGQRGVRGGEGVREAGGTGGQRRGGEGRGEG